MTTEPEFGTVQLVIKQVVNQDHLDDLIDLIQNEGVGYVSDVLIVQQGTFPLSRISTRESADG